MINIVNFLLYHSPFFYLIQSIWRDEAFSYFMARPNPIQIIINTANDFNPPFYYLLLHFWILIVGKSDELLRLISLVPHLFAVFIIYQLSKKLFDTKFAFFVAIFTLLNPMLIYYAFEIRMYSFYVLFVTASLYFFYTRNWKWYTVSTVLGLYTHSFFPLVLLSLVTSQYLTNKLNKNIFIKIAKPLLFYIPWIPVIGIQFIRSKGSWVFPVDFHLILSVIGNLFTNYEGTPGNLWPYTAILSLIMIIFFLTGFIRNKNKSILLITPIFLPLFLILLYSILKQPLFVNRYMIFVTVYSILAFSLGIWSIKNKILKNISVSAALLLVILFNIFIPPFHKKTDFKTTFKEINTLASDNDYVYSKTPIGFLESAYYFKNEDRVFVYNPQNITIPNYIGVTVVFPNISRNNFPDAYSKTYLVEDDASYSIVMNR